jgi:hypothetical protein
MSNAPLYVAISSVFAAMISAFVVVRGQKQDFKHMTRSHSNAEVQTIFDGYGQIVEELRIEVERLMTTIAILQEEQVACDERNNTLMEEVAELRERLSQLEARDD